MRVIDPGHKYELACYDGDCGQNLVFMKREGEGYPFNVGRYPGTNCQDVLRALIDRVKYLNLQIPCNENRLILEHLRGALLLFEMRASRRHGETLPCLPEDIEAAPTRDSDGHIVCHHGRLAARAAILETLRGIRGHADNDMINAGKPYSDTPWHCFRAMLDQLIKEIEG